MAMKSHPYADALPLLEGEAFDALAADIKENGLREPIVTFDGAILDWRNLTGRAWRQESSRDSWTTGTTIRWRSSSR